MMSASAALATTRYAERVNSSMRQTFNMPGACHRGSFQAYVAWRDWILAQDLPLTPLLNVIVLGQSFSQTERECGMGRGTIRALIGPVLEQYVEIAGWRRPQ